MAVTRNIRRSAKRGRKFRYKLTAVKGGLTYRMPGASVRRAIKRIANQEIKKKMETKMRSRTATDGIEIYHNNFVTLSSAPFETNQGVADGELPSSNGVRIGDEVYARGYSMKLMVELNERFSDVTFRLLMVKCAKGDTPTRATLFHGQSGNKMIDSINTERYSIVHQKYFKIKSPNLSIMDTDGGANVIAPVVGGSSGVYVAGIPGERSHNVLSRATKIVSFWVPASKFTGKNNILRYQNASTQVKFFDYHVLLYAYSNYSTNQDVWFVARVNDTVERFYFKDA